MLSTLNVSPSHLGRRTSEWILIGHRLDSWCSTGVCNFGRADALQCANDAADSASEKALWPQIHFCLSFCRCARRRLLNFFMIKLRPLADILTPAPKNSLQPKNSGAARSFGVMMPGCRHTMHKRKTSLQPPREKYKSVARALGAFCASSLRIKTLLFTIFL